jgi:hypothetical protein
MIGEPAHPASARFRVFVMMRRLLIIAAIATMSATLSSQPASAAAMPIDPVLTVPIGPHVEFGGTLNGASTGARVRMGCFGPIHRGQTGRPLAGQTVGVFVPEVLRSPSFGRTGARARSIVARFVSRSGVSAPAAVFTRFTLTRPVLTSTSPLSTSLVLPCSGRGILVFSPVPTRGDAKSAVVQVSFDSQP